MVERRNFSDPAFAVFAAISSSDSTIAQGGTALQIRSNAGAVFSDKSGRWGNSAMRSRLHKDSNGLLGAINIGDELRCRNVADSVRVVDSDKSL